MVLSVIPDNLERKMKDIFKDLADGLLVLTMLFMALQEEVHMRQTFEAMGEERMRQFFIESVVPEDRWHNPPIGEELWKILQKDFLLEHVGNVDVDEIKKRMAQKAMEYLHQAVPR